MEEIDLKELFLFTKGKIGLIIIITVSVCLLGCIYGLFLQTPMYRSYTTVVLSGNESASSGITQNDIAINQKLINVYTEFVKSRKVLNKVISELNLDTTYEKLSSQISVSAINNTEIIKITVNDSDGVKAKNIANITAKVFTEEVVNYFNMNNVNILDEAIVDNVPYNINVIKQVIISFIFGLVLSCGIVFVIFYFDRTIKTAEEIESKVKLPILGTVQEVEKRGGKNGQR